MLPASVSRGDGRIAGGPRAGAARPDGKAWPAAGGWGNETASGPSRQLASRAIVNAAASEGVQLWPATVVTEGRGLTTLSAPSLPDSISKDCEATRVSACAAFALERTDETHCDSSLVSALSLLISASAVRSCRPASRMLAGDAEDEFDTIEAVRETGEKKPGSSAKRAA